MVEGPVGEMIEQSKARQGFKAPPYLMDVRPSLLEHPEASIVVLICDDPRLNPVEILSLKEAGPVVSVVRTPGGRAAQSIKSVAVMQGILNSSTIVVIHHTDCGLTHLTDQDCRDYISSIAPEDKEVLQKTTFGEIRGPLEDSIVEDIEYLRASSWIQKDTRLIGLKYDTHAGLLHLVKDSKPTAGA